MFGYMSRNAVSGASIYLLATAYTVACEQALRGALAEGWEQEGELAT